VTPSFFSTPAWPSAVPPPWLPMAGTMKGSSPRPFRCATTVRARTGISATPRLPTATATLAPPPQVGKPPAPSHGVPHRALDVRHRRRARVAQPHPHHRRQLDLLQVRQVDGGKGRAQHGSASVLVLVAPALPWANTPRHANLGAR
jgi:hypothetical protein